MTLRALLVLSMLLPGCLPLNTFYAEGVSVEKLNRDNTQCDVLALQAAPVANQVRKTAPRYVRTHKGGYWVPGQVYTVDTNAKLRRRVKTECMATRGYAPAQIPACPAGIARAAPQGATTALPRLTPQSCVIKNKDGSFQIITQG